MSGYIIPRNNLLEAGTIEPSNNNVISRAAIAGGKAMFYIPIYDDISMGDTVSGYISTDGDWHFAVSPWKRICVSKVPAFLLLASENALPKR